MASMIRIEVAYALPGCQRLLEVEVPAGTTLEEAVERSGIRVLHPEIDLGAMRAGIFGRRAPPNAVLREGDRVEIYRPLVADPKEARRRRAGKDKRGTR